MNDMSSIPVRIPLDVDPAETAWLELRAECLAEFDEWRGRDWDRREFEDFPNWLVSKASWNRPNKYEDALDYDERRRVK